MAPSFTGSSRIKTPLLGITVPPRSGNDLLSLIWWSLTRSTEIAATFQVWFKPTALGRVFFETPLQAIQHFLCDRRLKIERLDRRRKETERAITWAERQEGVAP